MGIARSGPVPGETASARWPAESEKAQLLPTTEHDASLIVSLHASKRGLPTNARRLIRRLPDAGLFHGDCWPIERPRNLQYTSSPEIVGLTILFPWRARRFDREICVSPEAERPVDQRQLLSTIQLEIVQKDAAVLQTERAFSRGPP